MLTGGVSERGMVPVHGDLIFSGLAHFIAEWAFRCGSLAGGS